MTWSCVWLKDRAVTPGGVSPQGFVSRPPGSLGCPRRSQGPHGTWAAAMVMLDFTFEVTTVQQRNQKSQCGWAGRWSAGRCCNKGSWKSFYYRLHAWPVGISGGDEFERVTLPCGWRLPASAPQALGSVTWHWCPPWCRNWASWSTSFAARPWRSSTRWLGCGACHLAGGGSLQVRSSNAVVIMHPLNNVLLWDTVILIKSHSAY